MNTKLEAKVDGTLVKSKTQHVDGSSGDTQFEAFRIWRSVEKWVLGKTVGSQKTHKSRSISPSKGKHEWHQKHNTLTKAIGTRNLKLFVYEDSWKMRFAKIVSSKRHINPNLSAKVNGNAYEIKNLTRWWWTSEPAIWSTSYMNI